MSELLSGATALRTEYRVEDVQMCFVGQPRTERNHVERWNVERPRLSHVIDGDYTCKS